MTCANKAVDQVPWIDSVLESKPSDGHAFVFSHKNLIGQKHKDVLFGSGLTSNATARDEFILSLSANGVRFQLGGHDHMHHRSIVKTFSGGASRFVKGAWNPGYSLGTYGIDPFTRTAWAVVNHEGEFAVAKLDD